MKKNRHVTVFFKYSLCPVKKTFASLENGLPNICTEAFPVAKKSNRKTRKRSPYLLSVKADKLEQKVYKYEVPRIKPVSDLIKISCTFYNLCRKLGFISQKERRRLERK